MKKLALTVSILAISSVSAFGGDLPSRVANAQAYVAPVYNWTGFYAGVNMGYSWGHSSGTQTLSDTTTGTTVNGADTRFDLNGVIGGGQIGYNWQRNNWLFGLEADIQGSGQRGNGNSVCPGGVGSTTSTSAVFVNGPCSLGHTGDTPAGNVAALPSTNSLSASLDWFGTLRGRIGPTITPTILAYVTGGLAYGEVRTTNAIDGINLVGGQGVNTPPTFVPINTSSSSRSTRAGWTVGGGLEGVVIGNLTAKIEYLYVDLGTVSGTFVAPLLTPSGGSLISRYTAHITDNIVRVGLNYKFGGQAVAPY
jgi:outer membrane immunogenic protein